MWFKLRKNKTTRKPTHEPFLRDDKDEEKEKNIAKVLLEWDNFVGIVR